MTILLVIPLINTSCSTVQMHGDQPYLREKNSLVDGGQLSTLLAYLEKAKGNYAKDAIKETISGDPEINVTQEGEKWTYRSNRKTSTIQYTFRGVVRTNEECSQELNLFFDPAGRLQKYDLKNKPEQKSVERSQYGYELSPAFFGAAVGVIMGLLLGVARN